MKHCVHRVKKVYHRGLSLNTSREGRLVTAHRREANRALVGNMADLGVSLDAFFIVLKCDSLVRVASLAIQHKTEHLAGHFLRSAQGHLGNIGGQLDHTLDDQA